MAEQQNGEISELSVEEMFAELDSIVRKLDEGKISLEESFACYEQGMRLIKAAGERIDRVEKKMQILSGEGEAS